MNYLIRKNRSKGPFIVSDEKGETTIEIQFPKWYKTSEFKCSFDKNDYLIKIESNWKRLFNISRNGYKIGEVGQIKRGRISLKLLDTTLTEQSYQLYTPSIWKREYILIDDDGKELIKTSLKFNWKTLSYDHTVHIDELKHEVNVKELLLGNFTCMLRLAMAQG